MIAFSNKHPKCKQGFARKKEEKQSNFADSFPLETTAIPLLSEKNCTWADLSGIARIQMATHIKSVEGSESLAL